MDLPVSRQDINNVKSDIIDSSQNSYHHTDLNIAFEDISQLEINEKKRSKLLIQDLSKLSNIKKLEFILSQMKLKDDKLLQKIKKYLEIKRLILEKASDDIIIDMIKKNQQNSQHQTPNIGSHNQIHQTSTNGEDSNKTNEHYKSNKIPKKYNELVSKLLNKQSIVRKGGTSDDFVNLKEQIINFYKNDIILKYIYNYDQIILFNYLNYIISKYDKIDLLLKNKLLFKLVNKNYINNLISKLKSKLDLEEKKEEKKEELFELKQFFKNGDIIIEGFDNFINYLFIYLLSVKNATNNIIINDTIYNLDDFPTLNIYKLQNKNIIITMSDEEENISYELLNNIELLLELIYEKFNYLKNEEKEFNSNYSFIINENILNFMNKINHYDSKKILNNLKDIEMKINKIDIYGGSNNTEEDIKTKVSNIISSSVDTVVKTIKENVTDKFITKKENNNYNNNSVINRIVNNYDNSKYPDELKKYEFYNTIKHNNLDPSVELELTSIDKYIFIVLAYVIRLLTLYFCYYYIDTDIIRDIKYSIYYYLLAYIFIFAILIIIINFDTFKLRILINYMNLHINSSGIFTHIILISLFVYLIYLLINNVIGFEQPPSQLSDNQKIKLKYKLDILTLIIYVFICIFAIFF